MRLLYKISAIALIAALTPLLVANSVMASLTTAATRFSNNGYSTTVYGLNGGTTNTGPWANGNFYSKIGGTAGAAYGTQGPTGNPTEFRTFCADLHTSIGSSVFKVAEVVSPATTMQNISGFTRSAAAAGWMVNTFSDNSVDTDQNKTGFKNAQTVTNWQSLSILSGFTAANADALTGNQKSAILQSAVWKAVYSATSVTLHGANAYMNALLTKMLALNAARVPFGQGVGLIDYNPNSNLPGDTPKGQDMLFANMSNITVPEPAAMALVCMGFLAYGVRRREQTA